MPSVAPAVFVILCGLHLVRTLFRVSNFTSCTLYFVWALVLIFVADASCRRLPLDSTAVLLCSSDRWSPLSLLRAVDLVERASLRSCVGSCWGQKDVSYNDEGLWLLITWFGRLVS